VQQIVMLARTLQTTRADLARVGDVLHYKQDPALADTGASATSNENTQRLAGHVEFKAVNFGYDHTSTPLLRDLSFEIKPGSQVAIVGGTGSGKSTVANLLLGLNTPWSGEILLDGKPILEVPHEQRINSMSGVSQQVTIFTATIRENITMWDETISDEEVINAMKDAACEELLERPGGLDADLAENGRNLSGGQQQRLEIARCLARNPSLLVLDGATSALDARTESHVDSRLRARGCTILSVSNRLNSVRDADLILVLEQGVIVERGTHTELIAKNGAYLKLVGGLK
jgi:ABC-type bacteriocin/lantibiotic exporter with double-glycine peptidase domain